MRPDIRVVSGGPWDQRCYIVSAGEDCVVIDPGPPAANVISAAEGGGGKIAAVLATHAHFDHLCSASAVCTHAGVPLLVSAVDAPILRAANLHSFVTGWGQKIDPPARWEDLDALGPDVALAGIPFKVYSTPGHTPGSRCLLAGDALFTGDTLMARGVIDSPFPGADDATLLASLGDLSNHLEVGSVRIYPGHGDGCSLADALAAAKVVP